MSWEWRAEGDAVVLFDGDRRVTLDEWRATTVLSHHRWERRHSQLWECYECRDDVDFSSRTWPEPIARIRVYAPYDPRGVCPVCGSEFDVGDPEVGLSGAPECCSPECEAQFLIDLRVGCVDCGEEAARHLCDGEHVCGECFGARTTRDTIPCPPPTIPAPDCLETPVGDRSIYAAE